MFRLKKIRNYISIAFILMVSSCTTVGQFGTGVNITFDPRTIGMQIDDTIMQKNLIGRLTLTEKKYFLSIQVEVLDGRIFVTGKVDTIEEKLKITKLGWEIKGARSVKNDLQIKDKFNFKQAAKDILITSQLRTALITNKKIKSVSKLFFNGFNLSPIPSAIWKPPLIKKGISAPIFLPIFSSFLDE